MIFQETKLAGAFIIEVVPFEDERGYFAEGWKDDVARQHGVDVVFNRSNIAYNHKKYTLRGMHTQRSPHSEAKLVRCTRGAIYDVIVDIRPDSPTYLQWISVELTGENGRLLYVPRNFLHGYQTLEDKTEVFYHVSGNYHPEAEQGARFDDPAFGIEWPDAPDRIMSAKDQSWQLFPVSQAMPT